MGNKSTFVWLDKVKFELCSYLLTKLEQWGSLVIGKWGEKEDFAVLGRDTGLRLPLWLSGKKR